MNEIELYENSFFNNIGPPGKGFACVLCKGDKKNAYVRENTLPKRIEPSCEMKSIPCGFTDQISVQ